jgi:hypothetical protein
MSPEEPALSLSNGDDTMSSSYVSNHVHIVFGGQCGDVNAVTAYALHALAHVSRDRTFKHGEWISCHQT